MLTFDNRWRFDSPGPIEGDVEAGFLDLINRISGQGQRKAILEHFKARFAAAANVQYYPSSNERFAVEDLTTAMGKAATNAPLFIEAFWTACEQLQRGNPEMVMPDAARINRILADAGAGYQLDPPSLIATRVHIPIAVPEQAPSLDAQAQGLIEQALQSSERALSEGNGRQAVQEVLWLLETISTAFRGADIHDGSIQGRYFNKIIGELRQRGRGHQDQILQWMMILHGYLSSPTGGGVRHGLDLREGLALQIDEARLYCNLIRSYLTFLIAEHERLSRQAV
ncbi:hypothetical protein [Bradyrhizobium sp. LB11.1]|uniref:hypothetical protein n=1 Tax=Bradyrhizobium sp. LB11.1 TaxID=3156326 RepID=UPI003397B7FD